MDKQAHILFILSSSDKIKKQLPNTNLSDLDERRRLTNELFALDFAIKKYSKKDIEEALQAEEYKKAKIRRKAIIEDEPKYQEKDFFYWFVVYLILFSNIKNKAFLIIGAEIFLKRNKYEYRR